MKAVVLAGGLAKRFYPITESVPKPLLPVVGVPIIQRILEKLAVMKEIDQVYISTNRKFEKHFMNFLNYSTPKKGIKLVVDNVDLDKEKLGSTTAIQYLINKEGIKDDLMIIAGDNLFDFDLQEFVEYFKQKKSSVVAFYDVQNVEQAKNFGVAVLDADKRIVSFEEKSENPKSTLVSTCCYLFPKEILGSISEYLEDDNNPDASGFFIKWLSDRHVVFGFRFEGKWFDIGNIENYKKANIEYEKGTV